MARRRHAEGKDSRLALLAEMAGDLATTLDLQATLANAVERITRHLQAEGGALFLFDAACQEVRCVSCYGKAAITGLVLRPDQGIVGRCIGNALGEIVMDVAKDPGFHPGVDAMTGLTTRSILCAPLRVKDNCIGAIELVNKISTDGIFSQDDLSSLEVLSTSAALAIINARMAQALVEQERTRHELELAAEIQRRLLPARREDGYPVHGVNRPARTVSGDFFDFLELPNGRILFCLGDVSGKGINAALLMAKTASVFRCLGREGTRPGRLLARVNAEIRETATLGMFVTMVGGIYDPATGGLVIANAGHEPALVVAPDGTVVERIAADAPPIGLASELFEIDDYPERSIALDGNAFFAFSDGVAEGFARGGGAEEAIIKALRAVCGRPAPERIEILADRATGTELLPRDDLTLVVVDDAPRLRGGVREPPSRRLLRQTYRGTAAALREIRDEIAACCRGSGLDAAVTSDIVLAVNEACQNVIRHGYGGEDKGDIVLEVVRTEQALTILVRDHAPTVDPASIRPRDLDDVRPGGLGTHFMREIMDEVVFLVPPGGGNLLKLVKRFDGGQ